MTDFNFISASPVWAEGRETEMNLWLEFKTKINKCNSAVLALTCSSAYSVRVNGKFVAFGPARCAHGFYRVDEFDLTSSLADGENVITITVAGYNINSYYHIDQPSFLCAELLKNKKVIAATGKSGFSCREASEHTEKVGRYSYQRTFVEVYNLTSGEAPSVRLIKTDMKRFIGRGCKYTDYPIIYSEKIIKRGRFSIGDHKAELRYPRQIANVDNIIYKGYKLDEFDYDLHLLMRNVDDLGSEWKDEPAENATVADGTYAIYKMKINTTGMLSLSVSCEKETQIVITFDEVLRDGERLDYRRIGNTNAATWTIPAGEHILETFEPYTLEYAAIYAIGGDVTVKNLKMIYFGANKPEKTLNSDDEKLRAIFDAAVETYRQNTFTLYMDCPSRERAGWLCDSFFTSRVERTLTGKSEIEHNFLENFLLPESFRALPVGMLPMCYPGDHYNGNFIPNWAMWYVIELEEYFRRTGDEILVAQSKGKVYKLLDYFKSFENEFGLLESLKGWVFVEWSKSNDLTQDVSFPSNMLYALMLRKVGALYSDNESIEKADKIDSEINRLAMKDGFYCDNALRGTGGSLTLSGECTETCQYYAFFCGTATPEKNPELWNKLLCDFGPGRDTEKVYPNIYPSNAFIGFYLRLELLYIYGKHDELVSDIKEYFYKMACLTGTLWENKDSSASCNHGFASHVIYWLDKLGLVK